MPSPEWVIERGIGEIRVDTAGTAGVRERPGTVNPLVLVLGDVLQQDFILPYKQS